MFKAATITKFLALCLCFALGPQVWSQSRLEISEEDIESIKASMSELGQAISYGQKVVEAEQKKAKERAKRAGLTPLLHGNLGKVLLHVKGNSGESFPEAVRPEASLEALEPVKKLAEEKLRALVDKQIEQMQHRELITVCESSRKVVRRVSPKSPERKGYNDLLYIPDSLHTEDDAAAFGQKPKVGMFKDKMLTDLKVLINNLGIDCLPYRIRMGTKGVEVLKGEPALRNYDNDEKEGKLDREVRMKWEALRITESL